MPEEIHELHEHAEHGHRDPTLGPITLTMAILAVLLAAVSLPGHRVHTEQLLLETRSADQWTYYQAKSTWRRNHELFLDGLSIFSLKDPELAEKVREKYAREVDRYSRTYRRRLRPKRATWRGRRTSSNAERTASIWAKSCSRPRRSSLPSRC